MIVIVIVHDEVVVIDKVLLSRHHEGAREGHQLHRDGEFEMPAQHHHEAAHDTHTNQAIVLLRSLSPHSINQSSAIQAPLRSIQYGGFHTVRWK